jgi:organic hydroperoxide reductase OsmC/OhrA
MKITARIENSPGSHRVSLQTDGRQHSIDIPPRREGLGSSANGGELLFLALATCYCNDIYREAAKRGIQVQRVDVEVEGDFDGVGAPAQGVTYHARVVARAGEQDIRELMAHTDQVAEIQNTLRVETPVTLGRVNAVSLPGG